MIHTSWKFQEREDATSSGTRRDSETLLDDRERAMDASGMALGVRDQESARGAVQVLKRRSAIGNLDGAVRRSRERVNCGRKRNVCISVLARRKVARRCWRGKLSCSNRCHIAIYHVLKIHRLLLLLGDLVGFILERNVAGLALDWFRAASQLDVHVGGCPTIICRQCSRSETSCYKS